MLNFDLMAILRIEKQLCECRFFMVTVVLSVSGGW